MRVILLLRHRLLSLVLGCRLQEPAGVPLDLVRGYEVLEGSSVSPVPDWIVFTHAAVSDQEHPPPGRT